MRVVPDPTLMPEPGVTQQVGPHMETAVVSKIGDATAIGRLGNSLRVELADTRAVTSGRVA